MLSRWQWIMRRIGRSLRLRVILFSIAAIATGLAGLVLDEFIPSDWSAHIGSGAVSSLLEIIATSMLAVTTFSLNIMTGALGTATSNVTPRATRLLIEDSTSQTVLGTFIGSFIYAVVGIIALNAGLYGNGGRLVQFAVTLAVIGVIVVTLISWIDYLTRIGRVSDTAARVETAAAKALRDRISHPCLGGRPLRPGAIPSDARPLMTPETGYLTFIDMEALSTWTKNAEGTVWVTQLPGAFMDPTKPLAYLRAGKEDAPDDPLDAFSVDANRTYDQDPRFGLCVLAEIASRALSPAVNDPGTAIEVIGRVQRILSLWAEYEPRKQDHDGEIEFDDVFVPPLDCDDLLDDTYAPISRDGAGLIEVQLRLQKSLATLSRLGSPALASAARRQSRHALQRANAALGLEHERERLAQAAAL
ncbi:MAG: DUF2254 domain-containing protein [Hyphomicrobiaceae bacterium]